MGMKENENLELIPAQLCCFYRS